MDIMMMIDEYHKLYERSRIWEMNSFMGVPCWKLPMDMMVIQELIVKIRPEFIIETGTGCGGSALFYASICELLGEGHVITCDIESKVDHSKIGMYEWADRITFLHGSSTNKLIADKIEEKVSGKKNIVILDSWHSYEHVCREMEIYSEFVPVDSYMIVEDTHVSGHPVPWVHGKGPYESVEYWLSLHGDEWEVDWECEKHLMTFNPKGYLKRINGILY
jgi:cephalosporin hydroxylase